MEFRLLDINDKNAINSLSAYATEIVREHFDPIIGSAQNDYMLALFQTPQAIKQQLGEGYQYYEIYDGKRIGFISIKPKGNELYISKFYLHKSARGNGYARKMLAFIIRQAKTMNLKSLVLNVNKENSAIQVYEKLGFVRIREECNDIGQGYVMDDYVYQYIIKE